MIIFDFITQEEIDDLPDDDPQSAFVRFVRIAQRRLGERTKTIDTSDQPGWRELDEARHGFMNVVVAAAKNYGIQPFASLAIPRLREFDSDTNQQFRADLDRRPRDGFPGRGFSPGRKAQHHIGRGEESQDRRRDQVRAGTRRGLQVRPQQDPRSEGQGGPLGKHPRRGDVAVHCQPEAARSEIGAVFRKEVEDGIQRRPKRRARGNTAS
jgi:hypothetical protein